MKPPTVVRFPVRRPIRDRTVTEVKNLGWLLKHATETTHVHVLPRKRISRGQRDIPGGGAVLVAYGSAPDGSVWTYRAIFASLVVARRFVQRPSLAHCCHTDHGLEAVA